LDNIIALVPGNFFWKDKYSRYQGCNNQSAELVGLKSRQEIVGLSDEELSSKLGWGNNRVTLFQGMDKEVMETGTPRSVEESLTDNQGNNVIMLTTKVPLKNEAGGIIGLLGISLDITARKHAEEALLKAKERAEQANLAKANFLAIMSHELRTPMNAILGMAQILNARNLNAKQKEYISAITQAGKSLLALINDILDFSKFEAGKIKIHSEAFDLHKLIDDVVLTMQHVLKEHQVRLLLERDKDVPRWVLGDSLRVCQILINLVGNAIKFTKKGYIKIIANLKSKKNNKNSVEIMVEDTGIGIPVDKLDHIFERFTQIESQYNRRFGGAGLGLAISKQLVGAMHGSIGVRSELGKGSTFWFIIPFKLADKKAILQIQNKEAITESELVISKLNYQLLLIEDNPLNQKVAKIMLEDMGCKVDVVNNGYSGIAAYQKNYYDLIFTDIGLPDMDGLEVIRRIRAQEINKHIPIVAMTAHVLEEDRKNCLNAGADDVLTKPFMREDLYSILMKWIVNKPNRKKKRSVKKRVDSN